MEIKTHVKPQEMQTSASSRKLEESVFTSSSLAEPHGNNENPFHYLIIDSDVFKTVLDFVAKYPTSHQKKLSYINNTASKKGFANFLEISCKSYNEVSADRYCLFHMLHKHVWWKKLKN